MCSKILKIYQFPAFSASAEKTLLQKLKSNFKSIKCVQTEFCYYVNCFGQLTDIELEHIKWMLTSHFTIKLSLIESQLIPRKIDCLIEIGPKLSLINSFSINAISICNFIGLANKVTRFEMSTRYLIEVTQKLSSEQEQQIVNLLADQLTEQRYYVPLERFPIIQCSNENCTEVGVLGNGILGLQEFSDTFGLDFDDWALRYFWQFYRNKLKRNPTCIEAYDLAQFNCEKLRRWFFKGQISVDGKPKPNLSEMLNITKNPRSISSFNDLTILTQPDPTRASFIKIKRNQPHHIVFTSTTRNFPTSVSPFHGATTAVSARIRDGQAVGRGAHVRAGIAGYAFGNLKTQHVSENVATPLQICIQASYGASDYCNKFGEPLVGGFCRSFGMRIGVQQIEYIKPIMFSGGIGALHRYYVNKKPPDIGMCIVKIGGLPYRVGMGGSVRSDLPNGKFDVEAVPRGDAQVQQKLYRVVRGCTEHKAGNLIESMYSQGAGGNGQVFKQLGAPLGAAIFTSNFTLGDSTLTSLELWNAEYQESIALLIHESNKVLLNEICRREKCIINYVGVISGNGCITLFDDDNEKLVDLPLEIIADSKVQKNYNFTTVEQILRPLKLYPDLTIERALDGVLRLPSVGSKRFLTAKVDRCVTGLVAQQQCIGPCHTPLSDYSLVALNYFTYHGCVTAIGEQPIKGLVSPAANGRLSVAEALTNMMFCCIPKLSDVKCTLNWAWPAKLEGEGARLIETGEALADFVKQLSISIESTSESLSMAVHGQVETIKSPGTVIVSAYAPVPDIRQKVTPELCISDCCLVYLNLSGSKRFRLGASALAQSLGQLGNDCPDIENAELLSSCFTVVQNLIRKKIVTAGHDVSDGGLITCLLEMAFGTNCGLKINIQSFGNSTIEVLFAEECAVVVEVCFGQLNYALIQMTDAGLRPHIIGRAEKTDWIEIAVDGMVHVQNKMTVLRNIWEETSFELEKLQANPECVNMEKSGLKSRKSLDWNLTFDPADININIESHLSNAPKVAIFREDGSNCDREMSAAFFMVGFEVADVTVTDLVYRTITLDQFQGLVFAGGFSYSDVLGSARGWAATLKFNSNIAAQIERFRNRKNTFAFGCCNGCQLMTLLGWVGPKADGSQGTMLAQNVSRKFECRFVNVKIPENSPAIMFKGMQGSVMGVWAVHGEGQFVFQEETVKTSIVKHNLISLVYLDDEGHPTTTYPMCPNGSQDGIAGICSEDGRFLALMPHPDRAAFSWQLPYVPQNMKHLRDNLGSHWAKMFENAYKWALEN